MPFEVEEGGGAAGGSGVSHSETSLNKIYAIYPEYRELILPEIANYIDLSRVSDSGVKVYEFNKIRMKLEAIQKRHGYPVRKHHTVNFFDLVMFSIPFYTSMWTMLTIQIWDGESLPSMYKVVEYDNTNPEAYNWRKVIIYDLPKEVLSGVLNAIPFGFDNAVLDLAMRTTMRDWDLFENLVSLGGINNVVIVCNWDKIIKRLNKHGY